MGDVVAIEPFATDGRGKVQEGADEEIFALEREGSVRNRQARQVLERSPMSTEHCRSPSAGRLAASGDALRRLKQQDTSTAIPYNDRTARRQPEGAIVIITEDGGSNDSLAVTRHRLRTRRVIPDYCFRAAVLSLWDSRERWGGVCGRSREGWRTERVGWGGGGGGWGVGWGGGVKRCSSVSTWLFNISCLANPST